MLTRAGVAQRLRKSIATVRRMEGIDLHPEVDANGVHWFHRDEVDTIAIRARSEQPKHPWPESYRKSTNEGCLGRDSGNALTFAGQADAPGHDREPSASSSAAETRAWADQARATALAIRDQWAQATRASQAARILEDQDREERARLARGREALIDELARYSSRDLRRLSPNLIDDLLALLEDDG